MHRKLRNSFRFMLGNLSDFDPVQDQVPLAQMRKSDRHMLHVLGAYSAGAQASYDEYELSRVVRPQRLCKAPSKPLSSPKSCRAALDAMLLSTIRAPVFAQGAFRLAACRR